MFRRSAFVCTNSLWERHGQFWKINLSQLLLQNQWGFCDVFGLELNCVLHYCLHSPNEMAIDWFFIYCGPYAYESVKCPGWHLVWCLCLNMTLSTESMMQTWMVMQSILDHYNSSISIVSDYEQSQRWWRFMYIH